MEPVHIGRCSLWSLVCDSLKSPWREKNKSPHGQWVWKLLKMWNENENGSVGKVRGLWQQREVMLCPLTAAYLWVMVIKYQNSFGFFFKDSPLVICFLIHYFCLFQSLLDFSSINFPSFLFTFLNLLFHTEVVYPSHETFPHAFISY